MAQKISVQSWMGPPPEDLLRSLTGRVLNVCVGGEIGHEPTPFGEFFRFARVVDVQPVPAEADAFTCTRCANSARYRVSVEWEAGYESEEGNHLCEHCIGGIVMQGAEAIPFGPTHDPDITYEITETTDLRPYRKSDA